MGHMTTLPTESGFPLTFLKERVRQGIRTRPTAVKTVTSCRVSAIAIIDIALRILVSTGIDSNVRVGLARRVPIGTQLHCCVILCCSRNHHGLFVKRQCSTRIAVISMSDGWNIIVSAKGHHNPAIDLYGAAIAFKASANTSASKCIVLRP